MKLDTLIKKLEKIKQKNGGKIPVFICGLHDSYTDSVNVKVESQGKLKFCVLITDMINS